MDLHKVSWGCLLKAKPQKSTCHLTVFAILGPTNTSMHPLRICAFFLKLFEDGSNLFANSSTKLGLYQSIPLITLVYVRGSFGQNFFS